MNTNKRIYLIKGFFILSIFMAISGLYVLFNHTVADEQQNATSANLPIFTADELLNNVESRAKYLNARVKNTTFSIYTMKRIDNLWKVAKIHGYDVYTLIGCNPQLKNYNTDEGQKILAPSSAGTLHQIQNNDNWEAVAKRYGLEETIIKTVNSGTSALMPGEYLFIPGKRPDVSLLNKQMQERLSSRNLFSWPLISAGNIMKNYGKIKDTDGSIIQHNGIIIANKLGTPVCSSASGKVIFTGYDKDYGHIVYIEHENGYITEYGHLDSYQVKVGSEIKAGKLFARLGNSGLATEPCLYFAIKKDGKYVDPLKFLW
ncbi:MAG: peptidoglycan DD-metalloendopeptidase family protein [Endomicrobium sp.]|jgi:murein DD-endopeptidase MepM/ murein hydrolase activator NlpD|nr:peptidoglycan DD-metalloendopeptidase family protein [Endomicrobium sp.]